jgi:hypothetical protein
VGPVVRDGNVTAHYSSSSLGERGSCRVMNERFRAVSALFALYAVGRKKKKKKKKTLSKKIKM